MKRTLVALALLAAGCGSESGQYRLVYTSDKYVPVAEGPVYPSKKACDWALDHPGEGGRPYLADTPYFAAGCVPNKRPYPNEVTR